MHWQVFFVQSRGPMSDAAHVLAAGHVSIAASARSISCRRFLTSHIFPRLCARLARSRNAIKRCARQACRRRRKRRSRANHSRRLLDAAIEAISDFPPQTRRRFCERRATAHASRATSSGITLGDDIAACRRRRANHSRRRLDAQIEADCRTQNRCRFCERLAPVHASRAPAALIMRGDDIAARRHANHSRVGSKPKLKPIFYLGIVSAFVNAVLQFTRREQPQRLSREATTSPRAAVPTIRGVCSKPHLPLYRYRCCAHRGPDHASRATAALIMRGDAVAARRRAKVGIQASLLLPPRALCKEVD